MLFFESSSNGFFSIILGVSMFFSTVSFVFILLVLNSATSLKALLLSVSFISL